MKSAFIRTIVLAFTFSAAPCLADADAPGTKIISEGEVRILSAAQYAAILITACNNGWRYPLKHVQSGFKRHVTEFRLQLLNDGYIIVPEQRYNTDGKHSLADLTAFENRKSSRFGCARPYWLETRGRIPPP